jgi:hypothetical protein
MTLFAGAAKTEVANNKENVEARIIISLGRVILISKTPLKDFYDKGTIG